MLPIYISYFACGTDNKHKTALRAAAFVAGFTLVFTLLGLFAGTLGHFLAEYQTAVNIITGLIVVIFGLSYLDVIKLSFFKGMSGRREIKGIFSAFLFGMVYSVSLTPCVGAFLGSALMLASGAGGAVKGMLLLLTYSLGLGVPFVFAALLTNSLGTAVSFIKKNYKTINLICGIFLIVVGILMMFGVLNAVLSIFL